MGYELENLFNSTVKKQKDELNEIHESLNLEKTIKALSLSESEYQKFQDLKEDYRPTLYNINEALDDTVVGEFKNRLSLFTLFILSKNNVYVSGPSAAGKTVVMEACANLVMPEDALVIEGSSEKAVFDQEYEIKKASFIIIREINKVSSQIFFEVLKSWGEGKEYIYRRSGGICSKMSEFRLPPKPFVFSRADESSFTNPIGAELQSRVTEITVDGSSEQTQAVLSRQAETFENPFDQQQVDLVQRACLRYHITQLPTYDICINPAVKLMKDCIPIVFTTARRTFPIYKANADGIARFHWKERITTEIQGKSVIFATPADTFLNHLIFGDKLIESALRCNEMQKVIMQIIIKGGSLTKQEIQTQLHTHSINSTVKILESHLSHLSDLGYLDIDTQGRSNYYTASSFYKYFDIRPNFAQIVECSQATMESVPYYKDYADEYTERFCKGKGLIVTNPFDGSKINILDYDWHSVFDVNLENTRIQKTIESENEEPRKGTTLIDFLGEK